MRITRWMFAVALAVSLFSARPLAADGATTVLDVVILHGRVMDPETNLDAVRNVGISGGRIREISEKELRGKKRSKRADWSSLRDSLICMSTDRSRAIISSKRAMA